jgi:hypothetical protein
LRCQEIEKTGRCPFGVVTLCIDNDMTDMKGHQYRNTQRRAQLRAARLQGAVTADTRDGLTTTCCKPVRHERARRCRGDRRDKLDAAKQVDGARAGGREAYRPQACRQKKTGGKRGKGVAKIVDELKKALQPAHRRHGHGLYVFR